MSSRSSLLCTIKVSPFQSTTMKLFELSGLSLPLSSIMWWRNDGVLLNFALKVFSSTHVPFPNIFSVIDIAQHHFADERTKHITLGEISHTHYYIPTHEFLQENWKKVLSLLFPPFQNIILGKFEKPQKAPSHHCVLSKTTNCNIWAVGGWLLPNKKEKFKKSGGF